MPVSKLYQEMDASQADKAAKRALDRFFPDLKFTLTPLKNPEKRYLTWVIHCKARGKTPSFICKVGTPDAAGREKIQNQFARLKAVRDSMGNSQRTVPEPMYVSEHDSALIMQAVAGDSLRQVMPEFTVTSDVNAYLENAGHWLSDFHALTRKPALFDPKPHINWLAKKVQRHAEGAISIPHYASFMQEYDKLEHLAKACSGLPSFRCITHRDFHLGNLIFASDGVTYGIDFENQKEDVALRDVMSYLFDFMFRWQGRPASVADFQSSAKTFWQAYGDVTTSADVVTFFQKFTALNAWSGLDAGRLDAEKLRVRVMFFTMLAQNAMFEPAFLRGGQT